MEPRVSVIKNMDMCTGCGLCEVICPTNAIIMHYNQYGFLYPYINQSKCIQCGLCERKCIAERTSLQKPIKSYAGITLDEKLKKKSSSGGIFAILADDILKKGGVVFGAAVVPKDRVVTVEHIGIYSLGELYKLQGSKYVQSDARKSYVEVKKNLEKGKKVLFSGTPCQVAALQSYLVESYENLFTIDLICHGVPSALYWEKSLQEKLKSGEHIFDVSFRDSKEEYMKGYIAFSNGKHIRNEVYSPDTDSYCNMFLGCDLFRESCYQCKYARIERCGDITIGDFWGFEQEYDRDIIEKEENVNLKQGNSFVLINTKKGISLCNNITKKKMWLYEVDVEKGSKHNDQLQKPSKKGKNRNLILKLYRIGGWKGISLYENFKRNVKKVLISKR